MQKEYNSPQYFAQTFTHFLRTPTKNKPEGYAAEHHGNRTEFRISDLRCEVTFKIKRNKLYSTLEKKIGQNENKNFKTESVEILVDVKRSKTGRISGINYEGYEDYFRKLMRKARNFYKKLRH